MCYKHVNIYNNGPELNIRKNFLSSIITYVVQCKKCVYFDIPTMTMIGVEFVEGGGEDR